MFICLDEITRNKFIRSVRRDLCGVKGGSMNLLSNLLNYFYNRIILVLLYQYDVNVYSGLVSLCIHFDIHSCETTLSTLRSQAWLRNHVT